MNLSFIELALNERLLLGCAGGMLVAVKLSDEWSQQPGLLGKRTGPIFLKIKNGDVGNKQAGMVGTGKYLGESPGTVGSNGRASVKEFLPEQLQKYDLKEAAILERAQALGIHVETGIRMDRVMKEFHAPLPTWIGWLPKRHIKKNAANPQVAYLMAISYFLWQSAFVGLQALTFLGFLIAGLYFVAAS
jgi:hypothetical protein